MSFPKKRTLQVADIEDNQQDQPNKQPKQEGNEVLSNENQSLAEIFQSEETSEEVEDSENDDETETISSIYDWLISEQLAKRMRNWQRKEERDENVKKERQAAKKLLEEDGGFEQSKVRNEEVDVAQDEDDIDSEDFETFTYDDLHLAYSFASTP